mgnify:CR=1 FL=1
MRATGGTRARHGSSETSTRAAQAMHAWPGRAMQRPPPCHTWALAAATRKRALQQEKREEEKKNRALFSRYFGSSPSDFEMVSVNGCGLQTPRAGFGSTPSPVLTHRCPPARAIPVLLRAVPAAIVHCWRHCPSSCPRAKRPASCEHSAAWPTRVRVMAGAGAWRAPARMACSVRPCPQRRPPWWPRRCSTAGQHAEPLAARSEGRRKKEEEEEGRRGRWHEACQ